MEAVEMLQEIEIDQKIRPVIMELNKNGLKTSFCCQGNHRGAERVQIAYISFAPGVRLPSTIMRWLKDSPWHLEVDNEESTPVYTIYSVGNDFDYDPHVLWQKNHYFVEDWKKVVRALGFIGSIKSAFNS